MKNFGSSLPVFGIGSDGPVLTELSAEAEVSYPSVGEPVLTLVVFGMISGFKRDLVWIIIFVILFFGLRKYTEMHRKQY